MSHNVFRYLTDDGLVADGSNDDMVRASADKYYAGPEEGKVWDIHRLIFFCEDATAMQAATFGGITALTNGVIVRTTRGGPDGAELVDYTGGHAIKRNGDWAALCYDMNIYGSPGSGNDMMAVRWTFSKSGAPIKLVGAKNEKFVMHVQDATTGLVEMHAVIQGYEYTR